MGTLARYDCAPTLPTPGDIVQRYPKFIQRLQQMGVEIAVHSYHHRNLSELALPEAHQQLERAIRVFEKFGIEVHGFRCPYLGYSPELIESIPDGWFKYSSNEAIYWPPANSAATGNHFFEKLSQFYVGKNSLKTLCLPITHSNIIEIPVCVPDDLQLRDGLSLDSEGIFDEWKQIQDEIYKRGELFTLLFHPELAALCNSPFISLLNCLHGLRPAVWVCTLRDISDWWIEKSKFDVEIFGNEKELTIRFVSSPRATILIKGLNYQGYLGVWDGNYFRLHADYIVVPVTPRPFIGLAQDVPEETGSFLREQGYILDTTDAAVGCALFLDADKTAQFSSQLELIKYIDSLHIPLVRYWRWPDGVRSALSITGDLDVLSLIDYAARIFY